MKNLLDTNVVVDFLAKRQPFVKEASLLINAMLRGKITCVIPVHAATTIYYLIKKLDGPHSANESTDWILSRFIIASADKALLQRARNLSLVDFEDAVVVASAERENCDAIVSRDKRGFAPAMIPVFDPEEFLTKYADVRQ